MKGFNIKFVGIVEKYPVLYDFTHEEYLKRDVTDKAWKNVAKEVNLSVQEAKEKWRNLRTTFVKNLKTSGSSESKRITYYLMDAMKFAIPFVKSSGNPIGNFSEFQCQKTTSPSSDSSEKNFRIYDPEEDEELTMIDDRRESSASPSIASVPTPEPRSPLAISGAGAALPSASTTNTRNRGPHGHPIRKRKSSHCEPAEKAFAAYFMAKQAKMAEPSTSVGLQEKREEGLKHFVLSLIPDLMKFNDVQLRAFKRKVLTLIDDMADTNTFNS